MTKLLVCGGRDYHNREEVFVTLNSYFEDFSEIEIICGGAKGADTLAMHWAALNHVPLHVYFADWETYGPAAGAIRNKKMLENGKPDRVIAFPGGKGTANMIKQAVAAGVLVNKHG